METVMLKQKTAADAVYEQLKEDIITLYYKPGEKLSEAKIAQRYGVSRDPVRKSVSRLVQEGLVVSKPQSGTFVQEVSLKQGQDVCDIRCVLETYAIRKAIGHVSKEKLDQLSAMLEKAKRMMDFDSEEARQLIYAADGAMHQTIWDASGNEMVAKTIKSYDAYVRRIQISNMIYHSRKQATMEEMEAIVSALRANDVDKAEEAMRIHISNIKKTLGSSNS